MTEPRGGGLSWSVITSMEIVVDGVNITTHCDIKRSVFEMHAGPLPGTAKVYVRDLGHELTIVTGSEITLDIEDLRVWGGYVVSITSEYAFPADDTSDPAKTPRYFILDCSDYNILFSKRFIRNKLHPTKRVPKYPAGKHDDEIIRDLFNNYLDLDGDGLNYSKVQYVGTPQEDNPGSPAVPGMSWGTAMRNTALMPGAIYYIDASKSLAYADVDIENAPFDLSDDPNDQSSFGYSNMSIIEDGTMLCNDAFVWGTGLGQDQMTFKRHKDEASKAEHGLWQWSDYRQDLYRPASVLKRATSYVDGSTQNNRGHKDPAITIRCKIRKPGLKAGMKVRFVCNIHGYDDVIPIRSMHISFVNNTEALYELVLAHYLDEAWNTAEFPPLRGDPTDNGRLCENFGPYSYPCGITDSMDRTVAEVVRTGYGTWGPASYAGIASLGVPWMVTLEGNVGVSVSEGVLKVRSFYGPEPKPEDQNGPLGEASFSFPWRRQLRHNYGGSVGDGIHTFYFSLDALPGGSAVAWIGVNFVGVSGFIWINDTGNAYYGQSMLGFGISPGVETPNTAFIPNDLWAPNAIYQVKMWDDGVYGNRSHIWIKKVGEDREYQAETLQPEVTKEWVENPGFSFSRDVSVFGGDTHQITASFWDIDLPEYDRCQFTMLETFLGFSDTSWGGLSPDRYSWYEGGPERVHGWTTATQSYATIKERYGRGMVDFTGSGQATFRIVDASAPWNGASFSFYGLVGVWGSSAYFRLSIFRDDFAAYRVIKIGDGELAIYTDAGSDSWGYVTFSDDVWHFFRVTVDRGNQISVAVWPIDQTEETAETLTFPDNGSTQETPTFRLETYGESGDSVEFNWVDLQYAHGAVTSQPYIPGSLKATSVDPTTPVTITEIDPAMGTFTYEPPTEIVVCYSTNDSDLPPGGYGGGLVYRPRHVRQLGWGSDLDGSNCTMASACIALDRHTLGAKTSTPPYMRSQQNDQVGGTDLNDAAVAWSRGFGETLDVHWGTSWASFVSMINSGRGGILQGKYSRIHDEYSSQTSFDGGHAMYINEFNADGYALVYDPLARAPRWMPADMLRDYAEAQGGGACNAAYTRVTG